MLGPDAVAEIFRRLRDRTPHPRTELNYTNPFTLVVAVALSAQATDISVNKATEALFAAADTPQKLLELGEEKLRDYIKTIGLYNAKARNVMALSKMLLEQFGGVVPQTREELMRLPGVGRKTANVVLNEAFGQPTIAVDTHIFRVSQRLDLAHGKTPDEIEGGLNRIVPEEFKQHAHHWLLLHGRYICKARVPDCPNCRLVDLCPYQPKTPPVVPGVATPKPLKSRAGR
ncbi:MAG: endonuclease [Alphaproteobacteria bacterium]|nr:endonuclease [Alphaproteobacteria bacterium]